jgi:enoyl-CoA hydratase/carnithine racemase
LIQYRRGRNVLAMAHAAPPPASLQVELDGPIATLRLDRAHKRNALDDDTVAGIGRFFDQLPPMVRVVVLDAAGDHFSAGLDLSSLTETSTFEGVTHSRLWHRAFASIEQGPVPVVAALKGAVVGGGLELATAAHIRVADTSTYYALPEGKRGLFVGGGASVRVPRLIGVHRMADMMLTGRTLSAAEGHQLGLSQYLVDEGQGSAKARELAEQIAENTPITNFSIIQALPRIARAAPDEGYLTESLMAAIAQGSEESKAELEAFLTGRAAKVRRTDDAATGSTSDGSTNNGGAHGGGAHHGGAGGTSTSDAGGAEGGQQ